MLKPEISFSPTWFYPYRNYNAHFVDHSFATAALSLIPLLSFKIPFTLAATSDTTHFNYFFIVSNFGCLFIYENTFLHIFKCYCIVYIISIRQMKPCVGWGGTGCG